MLHADNIAEPPYRLAGTEKVPEFVSAIQRGGIEINVVMNVLRVRVGANQKFVVAFQETHGKFITDLVGFLWGHFARLEGLAYLVGDHIVLLCPSGDVFILPFGKQKLRIGGVWVTLVCGDLFVVFGFTGVDGVINSGTETCGQCFTFVQVQGDDSCGGRRSSSFC